MSGDGARAGRDTSATLALCLCGGGITGAVYELGALTALDDFFGEGFDSTSFDMYVGTSAGALLATMMANGIPPRRIARSILDRSGTLMPMTRNDIFQLDRRRLGSVLRDAGRILSAALGRFARRREFYWAELLRDLEDALPAGVFSLGHYQRWLEALFEREGMATSFAGAARELYIPAYDLDRGERVVFGSEEARHVSVPLAICASSAIPVFFEPVQIDGRDYIDGATGRNGHLDVALARGAELVVVVNPRVPIVHDEDATELPSAILGARRIRDKGLLSVFEQAERLRVSGALHSAIARCRLTYPRATILLIEPQATDPDMMLANPMNFGARQRLLRYGYDSAARLILARQEEFANACARHHIASDVGKLHTRPWDLAEA